MELRAASDKEYRRLLAAVDALPADALDGEFPFEDRDRCVRDVLGHLHAWHLMMLGWYEEGMAGGRPAIPAPGYTWRTLPGLNAEIWQRYQGVDRDVARADLDVTHHRMDELIDAHTDGELFEKKLHPWTGSTSLGAYLVSSTSSHYVWALKKITRYAKSL